VRALVTGGAGFIGSNLVDALIARGDEVSIIDDISTGRTVNLEGALAAGATLHEGSIADPAHVEAALAAARPEVVYHLAAQIDVRRSVADPAFDAHVNVVGTAVLLEAARTAGVRRFLMASTGGAIYGDADVVPTPEGTEPRPLSPYATSKAGAEGYLGLYERLHGLSTFALRLANVYGPRQDPKGEAGVIAIYCGLTAAGGGRATVFGDGLQTRDFVFVGDVVDAFIAAAGSDASGYCNVSTGRETTVIELAEALGLEPSFQPERPGEVRRSCLDPSKAATVIGWTAKTSLRAGLDQTIAAAG
jgi:UDP-glucose 4-epimerase